VNLAKSDHGEIGLPGDCSQEAAAIFENIVPEVRVREAEVQLACALVSAVESGASAGSRAESADEPGNISEEGRVKDFDLKLRSTGRGASDLEKLSRVLCLAFQARSAERSASVAEADRCQKVIDVLDGGGRFRREGHTPILLEGD
jgi:hypothetical protein